MKKYKNKLGILILIFILGCFFDLGLLMLLTGIDWIVGSKIAQGVWDVMFTGPILAIWFVMFIFTLGGGWLLSLILPKHLEDIIDTTQNQD